MSASKVPVVTECNGQFSVVVAPNTVLRWFFKLHDGRLHCIVKIELPEGLKRYEINVDAERDLISLPLVH